MEVGAKGRGKWRGDGGMVGGGGEGGGGEGRGGKFDDYLRTVVFCLIKKAP